MGETDLTKFQQQYSSPPKERVENMMALQSLNDVGNDTTVNNTVRSTLTNSFQTRVQERNKHERQNDAQNDGDAEEMQQTYDSDVDTNNTTK